MVRTRILTGSVANRYSQFHWTCIKRIQTHTHKVQQLSECRWTVIRYALFIFLLSLSTAWSHLCRIILRFFVRSSFLEILFSSPFSWTSLFAYENFSHKYFCIRKHIVCFTILLMDVCAKRDERLLVYGPLPTVRKQYTCSKMGWMKFKVRKSPIQFSLSRLNASPNYGVNSTINDE